MKHTSLKHGFTLIELMIVIVILGVLMGTILPRLTGAQARARDTGRIADLNSISQALETYYDDFGKYPGTSGTAVCLSPAEPTVSAKLAEYLKGGVPTAPSSEQITKIGAATCPSGNYLYAPLQNRGLDSNGYILASDVETYQNANFNGITGTISTTSKITDFVTVDGTTLKTVDAEDSGGALKTVYIIVN